MKSFLFLGLALVVALPSSAKGHLVKAMKDDFPSADLILALERGAKANVKH
jgi:hypothetical protein